MPATPNQILVFLKTEGDKTTEEIAAKFNMSSEEAILLTASLIPLVDHEFIATPKGFQENWSAAPNKFSEADQKQFN